jgi:hypothetical protein
VPQSLQRLLNGLALRIEDRVLEHDPDVSLHRVYYTSPSDFAFW